MDLDSVRTSYARWAPVYDRTFGSITQAGRRRTVEYVNRGSGSVLELGVGTGLALPHYASHLNVTGIDFSDEMLAKARDQVARGKLDHVSELRQMDARYLDFPDAYFDTVAAMHVLSVVPEPERVMSEIARVLKPGGKLVISNHFKAERGVLAGVERVIAPLANTIGWHSDFEFSTVLSQPGLTELQREKLPPAGIMTFLVLQKDA